MLFRHRLHPATQKAMLEILLRKARKKDLVQQKKDDLRRASPQLRDCPIDRRESQKGIASLKMKDSLVEEVCRLMREGSDQCRKLRSEALKAREQFRTEGGRCL